MWPERKNDRMDHDTYPHGKLLGLLLLMAGMFVASLVREGVENAGMGRPEVWGIGAWGLSVAILDVAVRARWGRGASPDRYLVPRAGPRFVFLSAWMLGLAIVSFALFLI
jgi:hypothetical protein